MKLVAVVGATATGKTALGLELAESFDGEIISCDSTAVYRGIDIGTDKPPVEARRGVPHHLIDVAEPSEIYSAARFAQAAAAAAREISARGRLPILVGGTGFYFRALVRGLFDGPARDAPLRARLERVAVRRGDACLYRWLRRIDPASALRIQPRDRMRLIRALEVYLLTGRPLTQHFAATASPIQGFDVLTLGVTLPRDQLRERVARRVDEQFARGVVDEVERLIAAGLPEDAHAFSGLVYRQIIEMRRGIRGEPATRALIVQENMRYAKRQVIWFRHEQVHWLSGAGDSDVVRSDARARVGEFLA